MNLDQLAERRRATLILALLGALLFLPLLGSFGLWDPHEVRIADLAKEAMASGAGPTSPGRIAIQRPPLTLWLIGVGFRVLGVGELGGRLPIALTALLALLGCYYVGTALVRRRTALLGTVALLTMPAFLLGARQLVTSAPPILASTLAVGGWMHALWPRDRAARGRLGHAALGLLGLVLGHLAGGSLLGLAVPLAALAAAAWLGDMNDGDNGTVRRFTRVILPLAAIAITLAAAWIKVGQYSPLLGGVRRVGPHAVVFVTVIRDFGFAAFPWVALLPLGLMSSTQAGAGAVDAARRERLGRLTLIAWLGASYFGAMLQTSWVGEVPFPGLAAMALLGADILDCALAEPRSLGHAGFAVFVGALILAHDLAEGPEHYAGAHIVGTLTWPPLESPRVVLTAVGIVWGVLVGLALGLRPSAAWRQKLALVAYGLTLVNALGTVYWLVPVLSQHLSSKGLFSRYQALGGTDGELGQYRAAGKGIDYYFRGKASDLTTLDQAFAFLGKPRRTFVVTPAEELPAIDQYAKTHSQPYLVIDDTNSRFLLLSNRLGPGEQDRNPLRRLVVRELARPPQHAVHADFEDKVELVGYDLPNAIDRGREFTITLYYKVKAPLNAGYKVFVHFDGPGHRVNGDHVPLDGKFPTSNWVPGFYIIDEHRMTAERTGTPDGVFKIYTGFWLGSQRLQVKSGPNDGENRVPIGTVVVR